jgi:hypothetical protein
MRLQAKRPPNAADGHAAESARFGHATRAPMGLSPGRAFQGSNDYPLDVGIAYLARRSRSRLVVESFQAALQKSRAPFSHHAQRNTAHRSCSKQSIAESEPHAIGQTVLRGSRANDVEVRKFSVWFRWRTTAGIDAGWDTSPSKEIRCCASCWLGDWLFCLYRMMRQEWRFSQKPMPKYALDNADIVREAIYRQRSVLLPREPTFTNSGERS